MICATTDTPTYAYVSEWKQCPQCCMMPIGTFCSRCCGAGGWYVARLVDATELLVDYANQKVEWAKVPPLR